MHPVAPPDRMKPASSKPKPATPAAAPQILVVDDEQDLLELLRYSLTKEGYAVQGVGSGEDALKATRAQPPASIRHQPRLSQPSVLRRAIALQMRFFVRLQSVKPTLRLRSSAACSR